MLKETICNNTLELSFARSIARKPQSFGGFKKIGPAEVEASTKARLLEKVNWRGLCAPLSFNSWARPVALEVLKMVYGDNKQCCELDRFLTDFKFECKRYLRVRVQVRVQKILFFEFKFGFEFGKNNRTRVHVRVCSPDGKPFH